jgi:hypothetical protein
VRGAEKHDGMQLRLATAQRRFVPDRFPGHPRNGLIVAPGAQRVATTGNPRSAGDLVMRPTLAAAFASFLVVTTAHADDGMQTRYVELINRAHDSVTSLAVAPAGSDSFQDKPLGVALRGGGDSATIEIASDSCLHDFRFGFRNGQTVIYEGVDVCRGNSLRIAPLSALAKRRVDSFETAAESNP